MKIIQKESGKVWGRMASGILFRKQGKEFFLQQRSSNVMDSGLWGVPGGALKGTEGYYESTNLERPKLDETVLRRLFDSALLEVDEEVGSIPDIDIDLKFKEIIENKKYNVNWKDNFAYVTFIVDLTDDESGNWLETDLDYENYESVGHGWFNRKSFPDDIHPGVKDVFKNKIDISSATIEKNIVVSDERWTQGQVFIEDGKIYDIEKLNKLTNNNRVEKIKIKTLLKNLYDKDAWRDGERQISPIMVMNNPTYDHVYIKHMSKIRTSDLEYPILVRFKDMKVLDGYHRLSKCFLIGEERIKAVFVQDEQLKGSLVKMSSSDSILKEASEQVCFYVDMDNTLLYTITNVSQIPFSGEDETAIFGEEDKDIFEKAGFKHVYGKEYYSKIRPFAKEFLSSLKTLGKVYLCTSASQAYADSALSVLGLDSFFDGKFYRKDIYEKVSNSCQKFFLIDDLDFGTSGIFQKMNFLGSGMSNVNEYDKEYNKKREEYETKYSRLHIKVLPYFGEKNDSGLSTALSEIKARIS